MHILVRTLVRKLTKKRTLYSSIEWINKIKANKLCSLKLARNLLHMDLVDIGSVGMWGFPTNEEKKEAWH